MFYKQMLRQTFPALLLLAVVLMSVMSAEMLYADGEKTVIRMGKFWCGVVDDGGTATFEYGNFSWFPNDYNCQGPSLQDGSGQTGSGFIMAATNWEDPLGNVIPKAAILWSPDSDYEWSQPMVTVPMTNYVRWEMPLNYTIQSTDTQAENKQVEPWGEADASKMIGTCDQVVEVTTQNPMGVEVHRKIFAWSQQYHDDYMVCDVTLTNNSGKTLTGFYLNIRENDMYIRKAAGSEPSVSDIANDSRRYTWQHYYGAREGDSLRVFYMYHGDNPDLAGDQMGMPIHNQDGRLYQHEMHFYAILHASKAPYTNEAEDEDDWLQPTVTDVYSRPLVGLTEVYAKTNADRPKLYDFIAGYQATLNPMEGAFEGTFHQKPNDEFGSPDWSSELSGLGSASTFHGRFCSFGPYAEFKDGEKLHFVYVSGFAGLSIEKAKEIGEKWLAGTLEEPPNLPNERTGYLPENFAFPTDDENNNRKNRWLSTGVDSVMASVSRAKWNYEHDWQVPMAPEPPHMLIFGTGEGVEIHWAAPEAEDMLNFWGYRIMRRVGYQDTVFYEEVDRFDMNALDDLADTVRIGSMIYDGYKFLDDSVLAGASYYYYVQSGIEVDEDDFDAYPTTRGKILWSGRVWSTSRLDVNPKRPIGSTLSDIRIVPNPYYISNSYLSSDYGINPDDPRLIMFFNLPKTCKIKIFTESGDLIKTIKHTYTEISSLEVSSGWEEWNMVTDNQQAISSGIYIAVFETPAKEVAYQKFIVVR